MNHDGTARTTELPPAPASIGEVTTASITRLPGGLTRRTLWVAVAWQLVIVAAVILAAAVPKSPALEGALLVMALAPAIPMIWVATADLVLFDAITWVGRDGIAIRRSRRGRDETRTIAFQDVGTMNLDVDPPQDSRSYGIRVRLQIVARGGARLLDLRGRVYTVSHVRSLEELSRIEDTLRTAPTDNAYHFVRRVTEAWFEWQARAEKAP